MVAAYGFRQAMQYEDRSFGGIKGIERLLKHELSDAFSWSNFWNDFNEVVVHQNKQLPVYQKMPLLRRMTKD